MLKYKTILADPPWEQGFIGKCNRKRSPNHKDRLDYPTMTLDEIKSLPVGDFADDGCHLWLWVTNSFLPFGFSVLQDWGFKYHNIISWIKPSGVGMWFVNRTQHILFGYRSPLKMSERFKPNIIFGNIPQNRHSRKPEESFEFIERVSYGPRLELFARVKRPGWHQWGNEIDSDIQLESFSAAILNNNTLKREAECDHSMRKGDAFGLETECIDCGKQFRSA